MPPESDKRRLASSIVVPARRQLVDAAISCWGSHARRFAGEHAKAVVAAVFARCLHLEADGDLMCIGDASIGNGPLHAIVGLQAWKRVVAASPVTGSAAHLVAGAIVVAETIFHTEPARDWHPPRWPRITEAQGLQDSLDRLASLARRRAPAETLARSVLGASDAPATALHRIAQPHVARFQRWTRARLTQRRHEPAPIDLLGLGPGLTPSGDDLLCGALIALNAIARIDAAQDLYAAIAGAAPTSTSLLSWASLKAAAAGLGPQPLHALIIALLENGDVDRVLADLSRVGHTSGWDALAGAMIVLKTIAGT